MKIIRRKKWNSVRYEGSKEMRDYRKNYKTATMTKVDI